LKTQTRHIAGIDKSIYFMKIPKPNLLVPCTYFKFFTWC